MPQNGHLKNTVSKKHRIVVIGLDACEFDLVQRWSEEGRLPFLTSLMKSGVWSRLTSTKGLFSDAPWPSFNAGVTPAKHAFYNHLQIKRGTTEIERVDAHHCRHLPFWSYLRGSGKRIACLDVPKTFPIAGVDGVQICGWGEHYPLLKQPASLPRDFAREIIARFGEYPHPEEVTVPRSHGQERRIYKTLSSNLEKKCRATEHLLDMEDWDLFVSVFSEAHYAGHQLYHHFEPRHWAHNPEAPADLRTALPQLHTQLDAAVARVFDHISDETTFFIVSVHGISTNYSANHLMGEVLQKLGYLVPATEGAQSNKPGTLLERTASVRDLIPQSIRDFINKHFVSEAAHDKAHSSAFSGGTDWGKTKAFFLPSDHFQAFVSVNLKGREPSGIVEPGAEFDALCQEISRELKRLVNPETGKPAVRDVVRVADEYHGPNVSELPDLVVQWAEGAPINRLSHPQVGVISKGHYEVRRTQHAAEGFLIAGGKHINKEAVLHGASTLDLAPTILHLMGQTIPAEMDGKVLFDLLDEGFESKHEVKHESEPAAALQEVGV